MILDTTVLIDLYREARAARPGRATGFLAAHRDEPVQISIVTFGEFAEGFPAERRDLCADILHRYAVLHIDETVAWQYATVSRHLRERGERIGDNDLWIAATALAHEQPLASRNIAHLRRVPRLQLLTYSCCVTARS
jgi:predicted nucleic acid-binding protein